MAHDESNPDYSDSENGYSSPPFYELEILTPAQSLSPGARIPVFESRITIGRSDECTLSFGDEFSTVSRKHAAIERKGDQDFFLTNLSNTNQTLLKEKPVIKEYRLNDGDVIQLSVGGPKFKFVLPKEVETIEVEKEVLIEKSKFSTYLLAALILVLIVGSGISIYYLYNQSDRLITETGLLWDQIESQQILNRNQAERIAKLNSENELLSDLFSQASARLDDYREYTTEMATNLSQVQARSDSLLHSLRHSQNFFELIEPLKEYTFGIYLGSVETLWHEELDAHDMNHRLVCTAFMLEGGVLLTSRQCLERNLIEQDIWNIIAHSGGEVRLHFVAVNSDGSRRLDFRLNQAVFNSDNDQVFATEFEGVPAVKRLPDYSDGLDWAYIKTDYTDGLPYNVQDTEHLTVGEQLFSLGFSSADTFTGTGPGSPLFSLTRVGRTATSGNIFEIPEIGYDLGSMGSPVFFLSDGNVPKIIGILTGNAHDIDEKKQTDLKLNIITPLKNIGL